MVGRLRPIGTLIAMIGAATLLITAVPASAAPVKLVSALEGGDAEVPDPGDPDGTGAAQVTVAVKKQKVCFVLVTLNITLPAAAAHIHDGEAGVAGPISVTLRPPKEIAGTGIGLSKGCVKDQKRSLLRDIRRNPDQYYVNVHTTDYPGGAVRGQLEAA
ncbi:MAG TPA: CHRD domain-containing protein [Actinomycetota bacterium]